MTAILHNKYHKVVLPPYLGFFGGSRFVPIVTAFAAIFLGVLMFSFGQAYKPAFTMLVDL